jgi:hypothetical protein
VIWPTVVFSIAKNAPAERLIPSSLQFEHRSATVTAMICSLSTINNRNLISVQLLPKEEFKMHTFDINLLSAAGPLIVMLFRKRNDEVFVL